MLATDLAERAHVAAGAPATAATHAGRRHFTDTVGALIAGWATLRGRLEPLATSLGLEASSASTPLRARRIAYLAGTYAHCWELDDIDRLTVVCPGCVVLPAVLAAAELRPDLTWTELVGGYLAGYEVALGAAAAMPTGELIRAGWWPTSLLAPAGAAAAISVLLGHDVDRTAQAITLAVQQAGGLLTGTNDGRYLTPGVAADRAVCAALAADTGWRGPGDVFDHDRSPLRRSGASLDDESLAIERVSVKAHAAAKHLQAAIDIVIAMRADTSWGAEDIVELRCELPSGLAHIVDRPAPFPTAAGSLASAQFVLATAAATGSCQPHQFTPAHRDDPTICALADRIRVVGSPRLAEHHPRQWGACVEARTSSGSISDERLNATGDPERPLTDDALLDKFATVAGPHLDPLRHKVPSRLGHALLFADEDVALRAVRDHVLPKLTCQTPIREYP